MGLILENVFLLKITLTHVTAMFCISLFEKFVPIESPIKIISGQSYRQFAYLELYSSQISGHYHSRVEL